MLKKYFRQTCGRTARWIDVSLQAILVSDYFNESFIRVCARKGAAEHAPGDHPVAEAVDEGEGHARLQIMAASETSASIVF